VGIFSADRYVASLDLVDVGELRSWGVRLVLLDRDNTCVPRGAEVAPEGVHAWFSRARSAGLEICLVSNNFHAREVRISADELGCDAIAHAMKPAPIAVWRALALEGVPAEQTVLIGDQVFTDVVAANLAGVRTILVHPQTRHDLWYTQLLRLVEEPILRDARFEGEDDSQSQARL